MLEWVHMQTPIDFGKDFIDSLFHQRDAKGALSYLADDVVWITPDEIRHLRTTEEIDNFIRDSIREDNRRYTVDIASIKSAPTSDHSSTIVYEVNLIPQGSDDSINLRCSLSIVKAKDDYRIAFIGMSRKYRRTDTEQIRGFIENLPSGVLVLASLGSSDFRVLYSNTYFCKRLDYEEPIFYNKIDENPFFMMPYEQQKSMLKVLGNLGAQKNPRPMGLRVTLETSGKKELAYQVIASAAYKDGSRTIFYMLFNDLTSLEALEEQKKQKEIRAAVEDQKKADLEMLQTTADKAQEALDASQELRRQAEEKLEQTQKELEELREQLDADRKAFDEARRQHEEEIAKIREQAQAEYDALKQKTTDELLTAQLEAQGEVNKLQKQMDDQRHKAQQNDNLMLLRIDQLNGRIREQERGIAAQERARKEILKEHSKSVQRVATLIGGQTRRVASVLDAIPRTEPEQRLQKLRKASEAVKELPEGIGDLAEAAGIDPSDREILPTTTFSIAQCLETVRNTIWPGCREAGIIFSAELDPALHDQVRASKAGLQMVLLAVLENAIQYTGTGGKVILQVMNEQPVRGSSYYHFVITDTGRGIPDEKLPTLFNNEDGELSVVQKVLNRMGGGIQVTSRQGEGSSFEITVNMEAY